jgi:hypothetical protein
VAERVSTTATPTIAAVIAGDRQLDTFRNQGVLQVICASNHGIGDIDGVFTGFFSHGQSHCRLIIEPCRMSDGQWAFFNRRHLTQVNRATILYRDHQLTHIGSGG